MIIHKKSKWLSAGGRRMLLVQIWATGGGENYNPVSYEFSSDSSDKIISLSREKFLEMIETKKISRYDG